MLSVTFNIERDALRRMADAVHEISGCSVEFDFKREDGDILVKLRHQGARAASYLFKGDIREVYSYLNGWLHATRKADKCSTG
jgi:hypothetical protein